MLKSNKLAANIFTKISHYRNINLVYFTENVFDKDKYNRTISLNARYLVFIKDPRNGTEFTTLSRQIY